MDPTFIVFKCVEQYIKREKSIVENIVDLQTRVIELISSLRVLVALENSQSLKTYPLFEPCRFSKTLQSLSTSFTLMRFYTDMLKKLDQSILLYIELLKTSVTLNFHMPFDQIHENIKDFEKLLNALSKKLELTTGVVRNPNAFDTEQAFFDFVFADYDQKCSFAKQQVTSFTDIYIKLDSIIQPRKTNIKPYNIYASLN